MFTRYKTLIVSWIVVGAFKSNFGQYQVIVINIPDADRFKYRKWIAARVIGERCRVGAYKFRWIVYRSNKYGELEVITDVYSIAYPHNYLDKPIQVGRWCDGISAPGIGTISRRRNQEHKACRKIWIVGVS